MRNDWSGRTFPHPAGRKPFVGDLLGLERRNPLQGILQSSADLGPIFEVALFDQKLVFVTGGELAAELADETRFTKGLAPAVEALRDFVGDGLFTAYNTEPNWQLAHDLLMPAFAKGAMRGYHATMLEVVRELFGYWDDHPGPIDASADMTRVTLETIGRTAFSQDFGSFSSTEQHPFVAAMVTALTTGRQAGALSAMPGAGLLARAVRHKNRSQLAFVESFLDDIVARRRQDGNGGAVRDLLGIMLHDSDPVSGQRLDDLNIRYQILTFLVAGHETTSGALSFALYYLSRHPDVLAKAQQETDAILGADPDAEPTFEQVAKFRYLRRVLDESLRLWPTVPAFARTPRQDTLLGGEYRMTRDDWALVLLPRVQRDPAIWGEDAERFDPDRFLPERSHGRARHAFKAFGAGERSCIGRQFALHEAVLVLARLLHRFDLAGDPSYELQINERLTLMPEGLELTLTPRDPRPAIANPGQYRHLARQSRPATPRLRSSPGA